MPTGCEWNRLRRTYECNGDQSVAILKAATGKIAEDSSNAIQSWYLKEFMPFYEANPGSTWVISVLIALIILRYHIVMMRMGLWVLVMIVFVVRSSLDYSRLLT